MATKRNVIERAGAAILSMFSKKDKPSRGFIGAVGTKYYGQTFDEEYQADLADMPSRMDRYNEMLRSDSVVQNVMDTNVMPILSARFDVKVNSEKREAKKARQHIEDIFFNSSVRKSEIDKSTYAMGETWEKFLERVLHYPFFGFTVFEREEALKQGKWYIKKFHPRMNRTVTWDIDRNGEFQGIRQQDVTWEKLENYNQLIPANRLMIMSRRPQGFDKEGIGIFRHMYRPYKMKAQLMVDLQVGFRRYLVGVPVAKVPAEISPEDQANFFSNLKGWISHQFSAMLVPQGWEVDVKEGNFGGVYPAIKYLDYLDLQMALSGFSQWVLLGNNGKGSYSLSQDQTDFHGMIFQAYIDDICSELNRQIAPIHYANFGDRVPCPYFVGQVREKDVQQWTENVVKLVGAKVIPVSPELQTEIAQLNDIPEPEGGYAEYMAKLQQAFMDNVEQVGQDKNKVPQDAGQGEQDKQPIEQREQHTACHHQHNEESESGSFSFRRPLTATEEKVGGEKHFKELDDMLKTAQASFGKSVKPIIEKQQTVVLEELQKRYKAGKSIEGLEVPEMDEYREVMLKTLKDTASKAMAAIKDETGKDVPQDHIDRVMAWCERQADILKEAHRSDVIKLFGNVVNDAKLKGDFTIEPMEAVTEMLAQKAFKRYIETISGIGRV